MGGNETLAFRRNLQDTLIGAFQWFRTLPLLADRERPTAMYFESGLPARDVRRTSVRSSSLALKALAFQARVVYFPRSSATLGLFRPFSPDGRIGTIVTGVPQDLGLLFAADVPETGRPLVVGVLTSGRQAAACPLAAGGVLLCPKGLNFSVRMVGINPISTTKCGSAISNGRIASTRLTRGLR